MTRPRSSHNDHPSRPDGRARREAPAAQARRVNPGARPWSLHHALLAALLVLLAGCADACDGCGSHLGEEAAKKLGGTVDNFVNQMPAILGQIDGLLENNLGAISDGLAKQIQEVNKLLRENIDGINAALNGTIDNVDAMLAARMDQLFKFSRDFLADLNKVVARQVTTLTYNLERLIKTLEVSGTELLESAGFQVVRVLKEGNRTFAVVIGGVVETVVLVVAGGVMALVVLLAGIFFIRYRKSLREGTGKLAAWQLGVASTFFGLVFAVAALMVFLPSARASVASSRVPLSDEQACVEALPAAGAFVGRFRGVALSEEQREEVVRLVGALYQCEAQGAIASQRTTARSLAADLERMLGATLRCRRNEDCDAAKQERCEVGVGLCTTRCELAQHCPTGQVCHGPDSIGMCAPPCSAAAPCRIAGMQCQGGVCELPPAPGGTGGDGGTGGKRPGSVFVPGGKLRDVIRFLCPGPRCPMKCVGAGCVTGPGPVREPPPEIRPETRPPTTLPPTTRSELREVHRAPVLTLPLDRFADPRLIAPRLRETIEVRPR